MVALLFLSLQTTCQKCRPIQTEILVLIVAVVQMMAVAIDICLFLREEVPARRHIDITSGLSWSSPAATAGSTKMSMRQQMQTAIPFVPRVLLPTVTFRV